MAKKFKKKFVFTYKDFAKLLHLSTSYLRQEKFRRKFDPQDLESVIRYFLKRKGLSEIEIEEIMSR